MPGVLCGCASWAVTFREERRLKMFENVVLRKTLVSGREDVTGDGRKLRVVELHDLYCAPNRPYQPANKIKEKRLAKMWCGGGTTGICTVVWCGQTNGREQLVDLGIEGRLILKWILNTSAGMAWAGLTLLKVALLAACNEPSGSIKCAEFLD